MASSTSGDNRSRRLRDRGSHVRQVHPQNLGKRIAEAFDLPDVPVLPMRYNIAPAQDVPVVRLAPDHRGREFGLLHWGLIPAWANDPEIGDRMINARAETLAERPAF